MYSNQIGQYLPSLIEHSNVQISRKAVAVLLSLFKYGKRRGVRRRGKRGGKGGERGESSEIKVLNLIIQII